MDTEDTSFVFKSDEPDPYEVYEHNVTRQFVENAVAQLLYKELDDTEARIFACMYLIDFDIDLTQVEIAERYGVNRYKVFRTARKINRLLKEIGEKENNGA
jgi:DNA-directed RNA polymerase specialized sigma subunit